MKMSKNVLQFATHNPDLFAMFADYWNHYNAINSDKKIEYLKFNKDGKPITFEEKEEQLNAAIVKEVLRRANVPYAAEGSIAELFTHPLVRHETFAVVGALIDMVLPLSIIESIGLYSEVRQVGFGDSQSFDVEPRDLFVVSKAGQSQRHAEFHRQFKGQVTITTEFREISVSVSLYRVLAGMDSLANLVSKAILSMERQISIDAYNAFATACAALDSTATTGLLVAGYSQAGLTRLCQQVTAWNNGAKAVIAGTQLALQNVLPSDANYRYDLSHPYVTLGYLPQVFGYDILMLPQVANLTTPFGVNVIADDRLFVVSPSSQKIIKVVLEGQTLSFADQTSDSANLAQGSTLLKSWGVGVATNSVAGLMTL